MRARGRVLLVSAGAVLALAATSFALYRYGPRQPPAGQPALVELTASNLSVFRAAFDEAGEGVQVVALLSPT